MVVEVLGRLASGTWIQRLWGGLAASGLMNGRKAENIWYYLWQREAFDLIALSEGDWK